VHVDSRLHCSDIATIPWLGGQNGEEEKGEGEEGEKGKAPQEEVVRFPIFGSRHTVR
jgi:hypothetical protein